jgi:hypothetical protein
VRFVDFPSWERRRLNEVNWVKWRRGGGGGRGRLALASSSWLGKQRSEEKIRSKGVDESRRAVGREGRKEGRKHCTFNLVPHLLLLLIILILIVIHHLLPLGKRLHAPRRRHASSTRRARLLSAVQDPGTRDRVAPMESTGWSRQHKQRRRSASSCTPPPRPPLSAHP